jgi:KUP system potassium uptake protein
LPRLNIRRTSETQAGQIYLPTINMLLMVGVILLVGIFKNSDALANAYGLSVTGTMAATTALAIIVVRRLWKWSWLKTALLIAPLWAVDLAFLAANSLKLLSGGWVPVAIAAGVVLVVATWLRGSDIIARKSRRDRIPLVDFLASLQRRPRDKVPGTAVYLTAEPGLAPSALLHNLKHNGILHEKNVIVTVRTTDEPRVAADRRSSFEVLSDTFIRVSLAFGFMENPDVPKALNGMSIAGTSFSAMETSYFLGRRTIVPGHQSGLRRFQSVLFMALARNSADPSDVFAIPPGRVVEMGVQVAV